MTNFSRHFSIAHQHLFKSLAQLLRQYRVWQNRFFNALIKPSRQLLDDRRTPSADVVGFPKIIWFGIQLNFAVLASNQLPGCRLYRLSLNCLGFACVRDDPLPLGIRKLIKHIRQSFANLRHALKPVEENSRQTNWL